MANIFQHTDSDGDLIKISPYLETSELFINSSPEVILDRAAVTQLRDALTAWLSDTVPADVDPEGEDETPGPDVPLPLVSIAASFASIAESIAALRTGWEGAAVTLGKAEAIKAEADKREADRGERTDSSEAASGAEEPTCACGHGWWQHSQSRGCGLVRSCKCTRFRVGTPAAHPESTEYWCGRIADHDAHNHGPLGGSCPGSPPVVPS